MLQWAKGCLYSFKLVFWIPLDIFPEDGLLGQKADPFLIFEASPYCFSQWLQQSAFPPRVQKRSPFPTCSPVLVVSSIIDDSHSDRCEMTSHSGFNLHLSDDWWCWASFHMSVGHVYVLFGEVSTQVLCPFFKLDCCFWVL